MEQNVDNHFHQCVEEIVADLRLEAPKISKKRILQQTVEQMFDASVVSSVPKERIGEK